VRELGRVGRPRFDVLPEVGLHPPNAFGLFDLGVPLLLPFEAVVALVAGGCERLDLRLDGHIPGAGQHILPVATGWNRVFQVRVTNPAAERRPGFRRLFVAGGKCVMRVPEDRVGIRADPLVDCGNVFRVGKVAVRLLDDCDSGRFRVGGHLAETIDDTCEDGFTRLGGWNLVAKNTDVLHVHRMREVDESSSFIERLVARGAGLVHGRRRAKI